MNGIDVMFVIMGSGRGGASTQLVALATNLYRRGWRVSIVCMLPPRGVFETFADSNPGIPIFTLHMRRGVADPRAILRLARIIRSQSPRIVHSHGVNANILARITRTVAPIPALICTAHNINEGGRWREVAYRYTDFLCDLTTQVSQAGLDRYIEIGAVPRDKIRFIPNGVDVSRFQPRPESRTRLRDELGVGDKFVWLSVGRLEAAKDFPTMLRSFAIVVRAEPNTLLQIVGQGSLEEEIKNLAHELGLDGHIRFLGVRPDVPMLMNAADAYVMSSAWEGMPMVLLEASASGIPIVATDVGGNREVVVHGKSGFLVPPRTPEQLAETMLRVMRLPTLDRELMGLAGRRHVEERYSVDQTVSEWERLYHKFLER